MFWPQQAVLSSSAAAVRRIAQPGKRLAVYRREAFSMGGIISKKRRPNDENDPLNWQGGCSYAIPKEEDSQNRDRSPFLHAAAAGRAFSDARRGRTSFHWSPFAVGYHPRLLIRSRMIPL